MTAFMVCLLNNFTWSIFEYFVPFIESLKTTAIKESTISKNFSNSKLCINKTNKSTNLENTEEAFIDRDIPSKNLKRNVKIDGSPMTLVTFSLVSNSDRNEILRSGLVINNQKRAVTDCVNKDKLQIFYF